MSRPVEMRASYCDDAAYLLRLEKAVLKDERQSLPWRTSTAKMVRNLSLQLLSVEVGDRLSQDSSAATVKKGEALSKRSRRAAKASLTSSAV